ncbi:MAG: aminopeptidase [Candidatus Bathyarchaeota archaeon]|nr:aminopeptidase [Candidatus Bathyarchaeota archaeon]
MPSYAELARQIVDVCLNITAGETVWIHSWDHTVDVAGEIAFACRRRNAYPFVTLETEHNWLRSLCETPKNFLETLPPHQAAALERTNAFIFMIGPRNPIKWNEIPPEKRELVDLWCLGTSKYVNNWRKVAQDRSVRMLGVEYSLATKERAQALGIDYAMWRKVMLAGCVANQREIARRAAQLACLMQKGREVRVQTPYGTKLKFKLAKRNAILGDSVVNREDAARCVVKFLPSGFVEVAPDEDSAEGTVVYDTPIPLQQGKKVNGLTLKFKHGKITSFTAQTGVDTFEDYLATSQGDADKFGFFGVGLNPGLKHGFTQDDKVFGGVTIGVGGNEDKQGKNRTAGNSHWWASMTHATVYIDKEPVVKNGSVTLESLVCPLKYGSTERHN